jgi:hypothetical protein
LFVGISQNISISTMAFQKIPEYKTLLWGTGVLITLVWLPFSVSRWTMNIVASKNRNAATFFSNYSSNGMRWLWLYGIIESAFSVGIGMAMILLIPEIWLPGISLITRGTDNLIYLVANQSKFGFMIHNQVLVVLGRTVRTVRLEKMKKVEFMNSELHFTARTESVSRIPIAFIDVEGQKKMLEILREYSLKNRIYFANDIKTVSSTL